MGCLLILSTEGVFWDTYEESGVRKEEKLVRKINEAFEG